MSWQSSFNHLITGNVQLPRIPVATFSQTNLFLVWVYREFRPLAGPQRPKLNFNWHPSFHPRIKKKNRGKGSLKIVVCKTSVLFSMGAARFKWSPPDNDSYIFQPIAEQEKVEVMPTFFFIKNGNKVFKNAFFWSSKMHFSLSFAPFIFARVHNIWGQMVFQKHWFRKIVITWNFMVLVISFFSCYECLTISVLFTKLSRR